jgi:hypothetical protein
MTGYHDESEEKRWDIDADQTLKGAVEAVRVLVYPRDR